MSSMPAVDELEMGLKAERRNTPQMWSLFVPIPPSRLLAFRKGNSKEGDEKRMMIFTTFNVTWCLLDHCYSFQKQLTRHNNMKLTLLLENDT